MDIKKYAFWRISKNATDADIPVKVADFNADHAFNFIARNNVIEAKAKV